MQQPFISPASENQNGSVGTVFLIGLLTLGLFGAIGFGMWAFSGQQDYKNNSDKKAALAVEAALAKQKIELQKEFDEQVKQPYKTFKSSPTYGSITFNYPKNWSVYVEKSDTSNPVNAYFYPDQVPGTDSATAFALRVQLVSTAYDQIIQQFSSGITDGSLTAAAYVPPKLKGVANVQPGTRFDGSISQDKSGAMVVIQSRDKTLQVSTESKDFLNDFNNTVLPSLTFIP